jgi:phytoene synthase
MYALYAFARQTDDIGDGDGMLDAKRHALNAWRAELEHALISHSEDPVLTALADTARRYEIPPRLLFDVLVGVGFDLTSDRIATRAELEEYSYHVAGAVGMACLYVWGFHGDAALDMAKTCGEAFQLTNILRDIQEDAARGRIYLPLDELATFDYTTDDLMQGVADERFDRLLDFQLSRAEELYARASALETYLSRPGRRVFRLMFARYRAILAAIRRRPRDVLKQRIALRFPSKLWIAARELLRS